MARYPNTIYGRITNQWPTNQFVGTGSTISGSSAGGISSITETWQIRGTSQGKGNTYYSANQMEPVVKTLFYSIQDILGYGTSLGPNAGIARRLPSRHPENTNLFASSVGNIQGIGENGKTSLQTAAWQMARFDITYETPPYNILSDAVAAAIAAGQGAPAGSPGEQYRYVIPDFEPSLEFIQRRKGSFRFPKIAGRGGVLNGQAIPDPSGSSLRLVKRRYTFTWCLVPDKGLFNGGGFFQGGFATNIEEALGKVNADTFFGYAPGTLLFESWKPIPRTYPLQLQSLNDFPRCWDVRLVFNHFNPPTDPNDPAQTTNINVGGALYNVKTGGHNAVPHPTEKYWYRSILKSPSQPVNAPDTNEQYWKYQFAVFDKIFRMCA